MSTNKPTFDIRELPDEVAGYIVGLRKEAAHSRIQRNGARAEADRLRVEVADRIAERDEALRRMGEAELMRDHALEELKTLRVAQ